MTMPDRVCKGPECPNLIPASAIATKEFCKAACRNRHYSRRHRTVRYCELCGSELPVRKRRYCSGCADLGYKLHRRLLYRFFDCKQCGETLPTPRNVRREYCDDRCRDIYFTENSPNSKLHRRNPLIYTHCEGCGEPLPEVRYANKRFCARGSYCQVKAYRAKVKAHAHPC